MHKVYIQVILYVDKLKTECLRTGKDTILLKIYLTYVICMSYTLI